MKKVRDINITVDDLKSFEEEKQNLQPLSRHGYLIEAPHMSLAVPGYGEMSGTTLRSALATADMNTFKNIMGWFDPKIYQLLRKKFSSSIAEFLTTINIKDYLTEGSTAGAQGKADVDDGPRYFYGNQTTYRKQTSNMAKRLGFEVINYIIKDNRVRT